MKIQQIYQQRLRRYKTAMLNENPDRVPIRPFVAEFTAKVGFTNQEVANYSEMTIRTASGIGLHAQNPTISELSPSE